MIERVASRAETDSSNDRLLTGRCTCDRVIIAGLAGTFCGDCHQGSQRGETMRRLLGGAFVLVAAIALGSFTGAARAVTPECDEPTALCTEPLDSIGYGGEYTGHDEPSLLFYSSTRAPETRISTTCTLPTDPKVLPNQSGTGGTWNFQLHPAFWLGMALCDNQSGPEYTHAPCTPDSDTNIFDGTDPAGAGLHRQAPGHGVPGAPVLPARLGSLAAGSQLRRDQVVRRDGDLQPEPGPEHRRAEQRRLPEHRRDRAGELRVHHEERRPARAARSARPDATARSPRARRPTCS